jgi:uncharacterized damage-inducible protein DinB
MSKITVIAAAGLLFFSTSLTAQQNAQKKPMPTLKTILLQQFRTTDDQADWFVPVMKSVEGITAQQAMWKPNDSSHSIGQLVYHIWFWNKQSLDKFYGRTPDKFDGNNNETFNDFTEASWTSTVEKLGQVMKDWEKAIEESDDAKLQSWYSTIAHINMHTAYHTGQILYVRKLAGNWDSAKGVH